MIYILFWIVASVLLVFSIAAYVIFSRKNKLIADLDDKLQRAAAKILELGKENQELKFQNDTLSKLVMQYGDLQQPQSGKIPDQ